MEHTGITGRTLAFLRGDVIDRHVEDVRKQNYNYLRSLSLLGLCTSAFTIAVGQAMGGVNGFDILFLLLFVYFVLVYALSVFIRRLTVRTTLVMYIVLAPLMVIGIVMGTFLDPDVLSLTIIVFLCILPLFILDRPWRVITFIAVFAGAYAVCCYFAKPRELFYQDMMDLILFGFFGTGVNCLILNDRLKNLEYAYSMRKASETDALTSLYNRRAGEQNIQALLEQRQHGMFCIIDIDGFKMINDRNGHICGDEVLKSVARTLSGSFRSGDVIARIGGDEFVVYAVGVRDVAAGAVCIERLFGRVRGIAVEGLDTVRASISLGATFFNPGDEKGFDALYREADEALYEAKRSGKGQYFFHEAPQPENI